RHRYQAHRTPDFGVAVVRTGSTRSRDPGGHATPPTEPRPPVRDVDSRPHASEGAARRPPEERVQHAPGKREPTHKPQEGAMSVTTATRTARRTVFVTTFTDGLLDPEREMLGPVQDGGTIVAHTAPGCWGPMITPRLRGGHEVTEPVAVEGAEPGD